MHNSEAQRFLTWTWRRGPKVYHSVHVWTWRRELKVSHSVQVWTWRRELKVYHSVQVWTWNRFSQLKYFANFYFSLSKRFLGRLSEMWQSRRSLFLSFSHDHEDRHTHTQKPSKRHPAKQHLVFCHWLNMTSFQEVASQRRVVFPPTCSNAQSLPTRDL